jgi:hypothetical protein
MRGSSVIVRTRPLTVRSADAGAMGDLPLAAPLGVLSVASSPNPGFGVLLIWSSLHRQR